MKTWSGLENAAPEIARLGRRLLDGCTARESRRAVHRRALDLLRDDRVYVHSAVHSKDATEGELKLAGRAVVLEDAGLRTKLDDLFWQMINWRPDPDSHYFEILAERAAYHRYGDDEIALRRHA